MSNSCEEPAVEKLKSQGVSVGKTGYGDWWAAQPASCPGPHCRDLWSLSGAQDLIPNERGDPRGLMNHEIVGVASD